MTLAAPKPVRSCARILALAPSTSMENWPPRAGSACCAKVMAFSVAPRNEPSSVSSATTRTSDMLLWFLSDDFGFVRELVDQVGDVFDFDAGTAFGRRGELDVLGSHHRVGHELGERF